MNFYRGRIKLQKKQTILRLQKELKPPARSPTDGKFSVPFKKRLLSPTRMPLKPTAAGAMGRLRKMAPVLIFQRIPRKKKNLFLQIGMQTRN